MWESIVINVNVDEHKKILCQVVGEFFLAVDVWSSTSDAASSVSLLMFDP